MTRLGICPLSLSIHPASVIAAPAGAPATRSADYCPCLGAACHLWQFEAGGDPRNGDCSFNIAAQSASLTAHYMKRMFDSAATAQNPPEDQN